MYYADCSVHTAEITRACLILSKIQGLRFTDNPTLTGRWCFYVNLPLGAVPATVLLFFRGSEDGGKVSFIDQLKQMDLFGSLGVSVKKGTEESTGSAYNRVLTIP
ncbi:hypothetical protein C8Q69DRAFT_497691 [Paecilomyces variotii]|uniref:Uncharacterized protein n=1 Tax=Byssochlamys spectabilis TaxID=264951 RepID=A0A443HVW4_BYSSP|nr:hypothetical protein C8Q69DRAFT_497691 [Paecilomyces variotii]RWQ95972.1 hypothetical protein C8Q69DRAFT_497691 [Paecilomyces variotii]